MYQILTNIYRFYFSNKEIINFIIIISLILLFILIIFFTLSAKKASPFTLNKVKMLFIKNYFSKKLIIPIKKIELSKNEKTILTPIKEKKTNNHIKTPSFNEDCFPKNINKSLNSPIKHPNYSLSEEEFNTIYEFISNDNYNTYSYNDNVNEEQKMSNTIIHFMNWKSNQDDTYLEELPLEYQKDIYEDTTMNILSNNN